MSAMATRHKHLSDKALKKAMDKSGKEKREIKAREQWDKLCRNGSVDWSKLLSIRPVFSSNKKDEVGVKEFSSESDEEDELFSEPPDQNADDVSRVILADQKEAKKTLEIWTEKLMFYYENSKKFEQMLGDAHDFACKIDQVWILLAKHGMNPKFLEQKKEVLATVPIYMRDKAIENTIAKIDQWFENIDKLFDPSQKLMESVEIIIDIVDKLMTMRLYTERGLNELLRARDEKFKLDKELRELQKQYRRQLANTFPVHQEYQDKIIKVDNNAQIETDFKAKSKEVKDKAMCVQNYEEALVTVKTPKDFAQEMKALEKQRR